jgi:hypothetical protein
LNTGGRGNCTGTTGFRRYPPAAFTAGNGGWRGTGSGGKIRSYPANSAKHSLAGAEIPFRIRQNRQGIRKNAGGGPAACLFPEKKVLFKKQERCMGVRIKPVEPTVIKDKAIIKQVIKEIRRKPSKATIARHKRMRENVMSMVRKGA